MAKIRGKLLFFGLILVITLLSVSVLANAQDLADKDKKDKDIERVDFIHYAKNTNNGNSAKLPICYKLWVSRGTLLPISYVINPVNSEGLSQEFITNAIFTSAETWDDSTSKELFNNNYSIDYSAVYGARDYENAIVFGSYPNNGVIAVTSAWINKRTKQIVEFDILFNDYYNWGDATINTNNMDLQNIAIHELGHSVGLNDIYTDSCSAVTMYGYGTEGETDKRTLELADITGLQKIYGI